MRLSTSWAEQGVLLAGCSFGSHHSCAPGLRWGCGDPALGAGEGRPSERSTATEVTVEPCSQLGVIMPPRGHLATSGDIGVCYN